MEQPTLFTARRQGGAITGAQLVLYALGEFQARGRALVDRELPLDRLRGALRRAAEAYGVEELGDEDAATLFESVGARVRRVPPFVAKHPYRVTVPAHAAEQARNFYDEQQRANAAEQSSTKNG
ncbi:MAG TPA: hypothetical protein VF546_21180 [Pyrinomonadaceae bacterium]|jgi:hypothetical protein